MVQYMWDTGSIPTELVWTFLMLILKGKADTQGIGLLEFVWKLTELVINTRIKSAVDFHDVLHGFRAGRRRGTSILELKLS